MLWNSPKSSSSAVYRAGLSQKELSELGLTIICSVKRSYDAASINAYIKIPHCIRHEINYRHLLPYTEITNSTYVRKGFLFAQVAAHLIIKRWLPGIKILYQSRDFL